MQVLDRFAANLQHRSDDSGIDNRIGEGEFAELPLDAIFPSPLNPRKNFALDPLEELASSIRDNGLLQPIVVRPRLQGVGRPLRYEIVIGERRYRAAKLAGAETIPAIIQKDVSDVELLRRMLDENLRRDDLTVMELARAYEQTLALEPDLTQEKLGARLGVSQPRVANRLRLLRCLPPEAHSLVETGALKEATAVELCALSETPDTLMDLARRAAEGGWTQDRVRAAVDQAKAEQQRPARASQKGEASPGAPVGAPRCERPLRDVRPDEPRQSEPQRALPSLKAVSAESLDETAFYMSLTARRLLVALTDHWNASEDHVRQTPMKRLECILAGRAHLLGIDTSRF